MGRKIKVCVVDDDLAVASSLCEGLREYGFDAIEAHTGIGALDACSDESIDLVLLDVRLPDMDGFEVCKKLKDTEKTKDLPVIFVTAKTDPADVSKGYSLGAVDYITKPYNLPMVMVRVEAAVFGKATQVGETLEHDGVIDLAYTDQLTGLKNRRFLIERLAEEAEEAHRHDYPLSCIVMDVDEIVAVEKDTGPAPVDDLLAEIAITLKAHSRSYDVIARFDGTTFAALLPHTPLKDAMGYATKIMEEVDATIFSDPNFPTKASMSVGIVSCQNGTAADAEEIFGQAMWTLLKAKSMSGTRIACDDLNKS